VPRGRLDTVAGGCFAVDGYGLRCTDLLLLLAEFALPGASWFVGVWLI
jgi:hypothetical protein